MGEIAAANIILALLAPKPARHEAGTGEPTVEKRKYESQKELLDKIDLTWLAECTQNKKEAMVLIKSALVNLLSVTWI